MNSPSEALARLPGEKLIDFLFLEGGMLALFFGQVLSTKPISTPWELWIECAWRVERDGRFCAGSADDAEYACKVLSGFRGSLVSSVALKGSAHDITIVFAANAVLSTFSDSVVGHVWELKRSDGFRYGCGPGNKLYARKISRDEEKAIIQLTKRFMVKTKIREDGKSKRQGQ